MQHFHVLHFQRPLLVFRANQPITHLDHTYSQALRVKCETNNRSFDNICTLSEQDPKKLRFWGHNLTYSLHETVQVTSIFYASVNCGIGHARHLIILQLRVMSCRLQCSKDHSTSSSSVLCCHFHLPPAVPEANFAMCPYFLFQFGF